MDTESAPATGEDLYSDGADEAKPEAKAEDARDEGGDDTTEAVLPKSILGGKTFNVGDEVVLKVTAIHDNQISVAYAPAKPDGKEPDADEAKADMPSGMGGGGDGDYD